MNAHAIECSVPPSSQVRAVKQDPRADRPSSSRAERETAIEETSALLRASLFASRTTHGQLARALGISASRASSYASGQAPLTLAALWRLRDRLPGLFHEVVARLSEADEPPASQCSPERHLRLVTRELGEVAEALDDALADGVVTTEEALRLDRELADVERCVVRWRASLKGGHYGR